MVFVVKMRQFPGLCLKVLECSIPQSSAKNCKKWKFVYSVFCCKLVLVVNSIFRDFDDPGVLWRYRHCIKSRVNSGSLIVL